MNKLKLDLSELRVESFGTDALPEARGTVRGNSGAECGGAGDCGCSAVETCELSCRASCGAYWTCIPECETQTCCEPCPVSEFEC